MPIYEMEPPPQKVGQRATRDAWEGDAVDPRPIVILDPKLDPAFQAAVRRYEVVFGWLFVIWLAWALGPHPLDEIARLTSQPNFWTRLFIGLVEEL